MRRKIMDYANVTATVLGGAYLVLLSLPGTDSLKGVPAGLMAGSWTTRLLVFLTGAFLLWINISVLRAEWKTVGIMGNLRLNTELGTTEFSIPHIEMLILHDLRAEPDILEPTVFLKPKGIGKPMLCEVGLKLRRQRDVLKRVDDIKRQIRDIIDKLIPGGLTVEVKVEAQIIAEPAEEFNGPVYSAEDVESD
ncbi:MAG: hypothetical protein LIP77_10970 [Planctomycetes bacterium]|nr:hypothetical protein [Planctomycetota bacterium]